jgi:hypothetical protein
MRVKVEEEAWTVQRDAGVDYIGVGDFALYGRPLSLSDLLFRIILRDICVT